MLSPQWLIITVLHKFSQGPTTDLAFQMDDILSSFIATTLQKQVLNKEAEACIHQKPLPISLGSCWKQD